MIRAACSVSLVARNQVSARSCVVLLSPHEADVLAQSLAAPPPLVVMGLEEREEIGGVRLAQLLRLARFLNTLGRELANCLKHPEALLGMAQQALVNKRLQGVEFGVADLLGGLQRAAAAEDG